MSNVDSSCGSDPPQRKLMIKLILPEELAAVKPQYLDDFLKKVQEVF